MSTFTVQPSSFVRSDVVEEYNKAVEMWFQCTHPSFDALRAMLSKVGARWRWRQYVVGVAFAVAAHGSTNGLLAVLVVTDRGFHVRVRRN